MDSFSCRIFRNPDTWTWLKLQAKWMQRSLKSTLQSESVPFNLLELPVQLLYLVLCLLIYSNQCLLCMLRRILLFKWRHRLRHIDLNWWRVYMLRGRGFLRQNSWRRSRILASWWRGVIIKSVHHHGHQVGKVPELILHFIKLGGRHCCLLAFLILHSHMWSHPDWAPKSMRSFFRSYKDLPVSSLQWIGNSWRNA